MKTKVFVACPTTGNVLDTLVYRFRALEKKYKDEIEFIWPEQCVRRKFHDFARNALVEEFLESEADILWFIDSDVAPPPNVLDIVTEHRDKWKLSGAPYPVYMKPEGEKYQQVVFTVYKSDKGQLKPAKIPNSGLDYVDGMATGCIFIKREVFKDLKKPYFNFEYNKDNMQMSLGEDIGFCQKVNKLGLKFFIDYSMVCKHEKTVDLLEINNYAVEFANKAVKNYDKMIRLQVSKLEDKIRRLESANNNVPDWNAHRLGNGR